MRRLHRSQAITRPEDVPAKAYSQHDAHCWEWIKSIRSQSMKQYEMLGPLLQWIDNWAAIGVKAFPPGSQVRIHLKDKRYWVLPYSAAGQPLVRRGLDGQLAHAIPVDPGAPPPPIDK